MGISKKRFFMPLKHEEVSYETLRNVHNKFYTLQVENAVVELARRSGGFSAESNKTQEELYKIMREALVKLSLISREGQ